MGYPVARTRPHLEGPEGFEPPLSHVRSVALYSWLSYGPSNLGGASWNRTNDWTVLQTAAFPLGYRALAGVEGVEPPSAGFGDQCCAS